MTSFNLFTAFATLSLVSLAAAEWADFSYNQVPSWADFSSNPGGIPTNHCFGHTDNCLMDEATATFVANNYEVLSIEKCFGINGPAAPGQANLTEHNFLLTARQLKALNSSTAVLFYWNVAMSISNCYTNGGEIQAHPEWWVMNSTGFPLGSANRPFINHSNPEASAWWVNSAIEVATAAGTDMDGVFADGTGYQRYSGVEPDQVAQLNADKMRSVASLQTKLHEVLPGSKLIGNGLTMYPFAPNHDLDQLPFVDGVCLEHFGAFENVLPDGTLNATMLRGWVSLIEEAVSQEKAVLVKSWVGPETGPIDAAGPSWPSSHQPPLNRTSEGIAKAAAENLDFPLAIFLCAVQDRVYFNYSFWYSIMQGYFPGSDAPKEWYPSLQRPLGKPLGPTVWSSDNMACTRSFESAKVSVDLRDSSSASIVFA